MATTNYTGATINGKTYTMQDLQDAKNQADVQTQLGKGSDMWANGADGNRYDLMTGKLMATSTTPTPSALTSTTPAIVPQPTQTTSPQPTIQPTTALPTQTAAPTVYDPTNDINAMATAQKSAALTGLQKSRDQSLSDLNASKAAIEPAYYTQRNNASTDSQVAAKNFAEYMASRGMNNANGVNGSMEQSNLANNVVLQGNLGNLANSEASAYAANAKQVGDVNTAYNNDVASSNAGVDANTLQALINAKENYNNTLLNQANTDRNFNYQAGRDTSNDNFRNQEWANTLTQQQQAQSNTDRAFNYQTGRDNVNDSRYNNEWANTLTQQQQAQANTDRNFNYQSSQDALANARAIAELTGTYNGQQTIAGKTADANIQATNANTVGQLIQNLYAPQIAQGQIDAQKATTAYQTMVNSNYPQEEALKIAGIIAQNQGQVLDNNAKAIANQYQPQILQGQIDGQKLTNAYQSLVNNGYNAAQAADIAVKYATIRQNDTQNAIAQYNAQTSRMNALNSGRSGGGGGSSSSSSNGSNNVTTSAWDTMSNIYQKYGYGTMISWLTQNKSSLTSSVGKDEYQKMVDAASKLQQNIRNDKNYNDKSKAW